jgi:hypothetical protein
MNYFSKLTDSAMSLAKQGMQAIALRHDDESVAEPTAGSPHRTLEANFRSALEQIESLANAADSKSASGDRRLQRSKVKTHLSEMVELLEEESNKWSKRGTANPFDGDGSPGTPCMDTFLQSRMVQELCNRAVLDNPRGCLPLVLNILSLLLQSVSYPLLPHMTVHKPLANLISVAVRYDAIHMYTDAAHTEQEVFNKAEYAQYRRRIGQHNPSLLAHCELTCFFVMSAMTDRDRTGKPTESIVAQILREPSNARLLYV